MSLSSFLSQVTSIVAYFAQSNFFLVIFSGLFAISILFATVRVMRYLFGSEV